MFFKCKYYLISIGEKKELIQEIFKPSLEPSFWAFWATAKLFFIHLQYNACKDSTTEFSKVESYLVSDHNKGLSPNWAN